MSDDSSQDRKTVIVQSARFGDLEVPVESIIEFPSGLIGFPRSQRYVMLDYKPPFSWLHSVDDPSLAFVVVDGFEFGKQFNLKPPYGDKDCELQQGDDYAVLIVVTVRADPKTTTANLKAPLFVNIRNRRGVQVIFDNPQLSTRHPLWQEEEEGKSEESAGKDEKK